MAENVFMHPDRKPARFKPFTAMARMQKLIADKEDTEQVFHIIEALNGNNLVKLLERFSETEKGKMRLAERRYLPPILDDHSWIKDLPEGTVGRAYIDFMEREGLSAQGLVDESEKMYRERFGDTLEWFGNRLRDTHDLFHVLSGYGRDALGEAALLAFTHGQHGGRGIIFIAYMGTRQIRKELPKSIDIMACYKEGRANGRAASKIIEEDIVALLSEPIEEARLRLGIRKPVAYQTALKQIDALDLPEVLAAA